MGTLATGWFFFRTQQLRFANCQIFGGCKRRT